MVRSLAAFFPPYSTVSNRLRTAAANRVISVFDATCATNTEVVIGGLSPHHLPCHVEVGPQDSESGAPDETATAMRRQYLDNGPHYAGCAP